MRRLPGLAAFMLLVAPTPSPAQMKEYAYGSSIDLQLGYCASPVTVDGDAGKAVAYADGGEFKCRYTYFFKRHFGLFGEIGISGTDVNDLRYFGAKYKADGSRYRYEPYTVTYCDTSLEPMLSIGPAYRLDTGAWSMRLRLGFGLCGISSGTDHYARYNFDDSSCKPEYFSRRITNLTPDYMVRSSYEKDTWFLFSPSVQLKYSPLRHFYFSVEAGSHIVPGKLSYMTDRYAAKSCYNPSNWAEAVYYSDNIDSYEMDFDHCTSCITDSALAPIFFVTFGIGWEIGWNRNYKRH